MTIDKLPVIERVKSCRFVLSTVRRWWTHFCLVLIHFSHQLQALPKSKNIISRNLLKCLVIGNWYWMLLKTIWAHIWEIKRKILNKHFMKSFFILSPLINYFLHLEALKEKFYHSFLWRKTWITNIEKKVLKPLLENKEAN